MSHAHDPDHWVRVLAELDTNIQTDAPEAGETTLVVVAISEAGRFPVHRVATAAL